MQIEPIVDFILEGFESYYESFQKISKGAKLRFEQKDWLLQRQAVNERMLLHDQIREQTIRNLSTSLPSLGCIDFDQQKIISVLDLFMKKIKVQDHKSMAGSFCISVLRRAYVLELSSSLWTIIKNDQIELYEDANVKQIAKVYSLATELMLILADTQFQMTFAPDLITALHIEKILTQDIFNIEERTSITYYKELFYRNKHAYLLGIIHFQSHQVPFALAFKHDERGIQVDACLTTENEIKNIFAFSRSYLQVFCKDPDVLWQYLQKVIPSKPKAQLLINLGYQEYGKELLLAEVHSHHLQTQEQFEHAPGIRGTVMMVFTLPNQDTVFKILRDEFGPNKEISHSDVQKKYQFIAQHDRVGRLVDAQFFETMCFPKKMFSDSLFLDLMNSAANRVKIKKDSVEISSLYMERKLVPLNIYLTQYPFEQVHNVVDDLGKCIRELAMVNIFPGDLLHKNFGVSLEKQVIFYDYDEVMRVTDCRFHSLPLNTSEEEMMRAESSLVLLPYDIFPEELSTFLLPNGRCKDLLISLHGDLFRPSFWNSMKNTHKSGEIVDLIPYKSNL